MSSLFWYVLKPPFAIILDKILRDVKSYKTWSGSKISSTISSGTTVYTFFIEKPFLLYRQYLFIKQKLQMFLFW